MARLNRSLALTLALYFLVASVKTWANVNSIYAEDGQAFNAQAAYDQVIDDPVKDDRVKGDLEKDDRTLTLASLHFAPVLAKNLADIQTNTQRVISAMSQAKVLGAEVLVTPELALTGYRFKYHLGTQWITHKGAIDQSPWLKQLQAAAKQLQLGVLLSHLEYDPNNKKSYNAVFWIDEQGQIALVHRKIRVLPGSESWSSPGNSLKLIDIRGIKTGFLICADLWPAEPLSQLTALGAELVISPANWWPGEYGPGQGQNRIWETRARESGVPIIVANRTGREGQADMNQSSSVLVWPSNQKTSDWRSEHDTLLLYDIDLNGQQAQVSNYRLKTND